MEVPFQHSMHIWILSHSLIWSSRSIAFALMTFAIEDQIWECLLLVALSFKKDYHLVSNFLEACFVLPSSLTLLWMGHDREPVSTTKFLRPKGQLDNHKKSQRAFTVPYINKCHRKWSERCWYSQQPNQSRRV